MVRTRWRTVAPFLVVLMSAGALPAVGAAPPEQEELLINGTFDAGSKPWWTNAGMTPDVSTGELCVDVPDVADPWGAIAGQNDLAFRPATEYTLTFTARADREVTIRPVVQPTDGSGGGAYLTRSTTVGTAATTTTYTFVTPDQELPVNNTLQFQLGGAGAYTAWNCRVLLTGSSWSGVTNV